MSKEKIKKTCMVTGCESKGMTLCYLGDIELVYCAKHFPLGKRVVDFFIDSILEHKISKITNPIKEEVFMNSDVYLCKECQMKLGSQLQSSVIELDRLKELNHKYASIRTKAQQTIEMINNPSTGSHFDHLLEV